jgi:hypothetical protein
MAQIIKHRRGGLESVSGATKRAGELLVITGSTGLSAGNGNGLLFVGIDGSTVTPTNKILTGSSTPDLTGGSYDFSIDGLPFYNTSEEKLYILAKGGNQEVKATANTGGTGIVSSSVQIDGLGFLKNNGDGVISSSAQLTSTFLEINGDSVISGSGQLTDMSGDITVNSSGVSAIGAQKVINSMLADDAVGADELASNAVVNASVASNAAIASSKINYDTTGIVSGSEQVVVSNTNTANGALDHTKIDFDGSGLTSGSLGLSIAGGTGTDTAQVGVDTLTFAGTANEIETTVTDNQVQFGIVTNPTLSGNVTVTGNFTVQGTQTSVNSTTVNIGDNIIELNGTGAANGGLMIGDVTAPNQVSGSLLWDATNDKWIAGASGSEYDVLLSNGQGIVSGSGQIALSGLSDYDANDHIDHTSVSVTAGTGLTGGGTIAATRTINVVSANNGIVANADNIELATASSTFTGGVKTKLNAEGVFSSSAQLDGAFLNTNGDSVISGSGQLTDMSGDVTVNSSGVSAIGAQKVINSMLADDAVGADELASNAVVNASVASNAAIASSKINYDTTGIVSGSSQIDGSALGSNNTISGITLGSSLTNLTVDNSTIALNSGTTFNGSAAKTVSVKSGGITNTHINASAAIEHTKIDFDGSGLTSGSLGLSIAGGTGTDTAQVGVDTLTFAGTANEIETTVTDNQVQFGLVTNPTLSGNVRVTGDLTVEGTTTTIDSTTVNIGDRVLELNYGGASGDAGLLVSDAVGASVVSGSLLWDASEDYWMAGALGSEKEVARLNASPTANTVLKADSNGLLVDSKITDDGTNVTISGTAELRVNSATANSFVYYDANKSIESVQPSTAGDVIQWNGSSFVASNEIDGGTF